MAVSRRNKKTGRVEFLRGVNWQEMQTGHLLVDAARAARGNDLYDRVDIVQWGEVGYKRLNVPGRLIGVMDFLDAMTLYDPFQMYPSAYAGRLLYGERILFNELIDAEWHMGQ